MDMEDFDNQTRYVKYTSFNVGDETTKYIANISGYSGDVGKIFFFGLLKCISKLFKIFLNVSFHYYLMVCILISWWLYVVNNFNVNYRNNFIFHKI